MTDDYTLVIPTYNRPALLKRLVHYYCTRAAPTNLLVLDSSKPELAEENAKSLSDYGVYVRHVIYPTTTSMAAKLARGLALVQTPYASFCGDDDLVFPDGLGEAIAFLSDHPDYVCAHGLYLNFHQAEYDIHLMREYAGPSNEAAHVGARIFRLFQKYESLFYAVFRTPDLHEIVAAVADLPTLHYQELFQSVAALVKGKVYRSLCIYAARQSCPPAEPERDKWQTYYWFADDPIEFLDHYRTYCAEVWKFYEAHGAGPHMEKEAFFRTLDLAHTVYFSAGCPPAYFYSMLQPYWPEDGFLKVNEVDLFAKLRGTPAALPIGVFGRMMSSLRRRRAALRRRRQATQLAVMRASLDREIKEACRAPWKCQLPIGLRWLSGVPDFRRTYLELCHYLDHA